MVGNSKFSKRRGLAALEFVLSLPILLFVMALFISIGTAAAFKVRGLVAARDAIFNDRKGRNGFVEEIPQPYAWKQNGQSWGRNNGGTVPELYYADLDKPVAFGPLPNGFDVDEQLLNTTRDLRSGWSHQQRQQTLLPNAFKSQVINVVDPLLDDKFQYWQMGISHNARRLPRIYDLPDLPGLEANFDQAHQAIVGAPFQGALKVLDDDDEFKQFYGSAPDFHPKLSNFCTLDTSNVYQTRVLPLIDRIQGKKQPKVAGVPETMAKAFLSMYKQQLAIEQAKMFPNQGLIAALQQKIDILEAFLMTL
jgi:hypothetical protein